MKYHTLYLSHVSGPGHLVPGFEPVAGIRVIGHKSVHWFGEKIDSSGRLEIGRTRHARDPTR